MLVGHMRTIPPDDLLDRWDSVRPIDLDQHAGRVGISGAPGGVLTTLRSYDNVHEAVATVYHPADVAELAALLRKASLDPRPHRITFRGGGQSLDTHALNTDVVIHLDAPELAKVGEPAHDTRGHHVTVGAAATWEEIVRKTAAHGLLPWSVVTNRHATIGGTVACDCLSRCSPVSGKEGEHVRSFKLLTVAGEMIVCDRHDKDPHHRELFHAVIGGMGYLGVLVEITLDLRPPVPGWASHTPIRVVTHVDKQLVGPAGTRWSTVLPELRETASKVRIDGRGHGLFDGLFHPGEDASEDMDLVQWDAVSSSAWYALGQTEVFLFKSRYVVGVDIDPLAFYEKSTPVLRDIPKGLSSSFATEIAEGGMFLVFKARTYVNGLLDFMFFMDNQLGPVRAAAEEEGWRLNAIQQTFVIPLATPTREDPSGTGPAEALLDRIRSGEEPAILDPLRPCFLDVMVLPPDDFLLSASRGLTGFAITVTWTGKNGETWPQIKERLHALSRFCRELGGRVHLVKNVQADREDLRAMYGDAFDRFLALKHRYDPKGLLRNEFFDRVIGPA
jgi:decaprenylphospho-beta-D-ribofuranose 2-oxidase